MLHPHSIHLARELLAEFFEQVLTQKLPLECREHPRLDLVTPDGQMVRARAFVARAEARKAVLTRHDEACAAHAALREPGEEVLRAPNVADVAALHDHAACRFLASLCGIPEIVSKDPERRQFLGDQLCFRIEPGYSFTSIGVLHIPQPIPHQPADVQLIVQDAGPAFRVAVNGARAPSPAERPGDRLVIQLLCNCLRRDASHELTEDPLDNGRLGRLDFTLASGDCAAVERLDHAIPVTEPAGGPAIFDASAQPAVGFLSEVLQEQGVHRALEADVQVRDVAFGQRDDVHAGEREAFEEAGRVFLVAAEAVERLRQHDIESTVQRVAHQRLESSAQQRRTGHRVVRVLLADRPALPLGERAADAQLISDGCIPLVV